MKMNDKVISVLIGFILLVIIDLVHSGNADLDQAEKDIVLERLKKLKGEGKYYQRQNSRKPSKIFDSADNALVNSIIYGKPEQTGYDHGEIFQIFQLE